MIKKTHPVRSTIFYGIMAALVIMPGLVLMGKIMAWPLAFRLGVWAVILGYSFLIATWSGQGPVQIFFPQLLLLAAALWSDSLVFFLVLALLVFCWIRQRCFAPNSLKGFVVETLLSGGAAVLILFYNPQSPPSLAVSIWLFFLIQSFYFVVFHPAAATGTVADPDRFARACRLAEEILSS